MKKIQFKQDIIDDETHYKMKDNNKSKLKIMVREFNSHQEAVRWIAENAPTDSHLEVLREELEFNHVYSGEYFINGFLMDKTIALEGEMF